MTDPMLLEMVRIVVFASAFGSAPFEPYRGFVQSKRRAGGMMRRSKPLTNAEKAAKFMKCMECMLDVFSANLVSVKMPVTSSDGLVHSSDVAVCVLAYMSDDTDNYEDMTRITPIVKSTGPGQMTPLLFFTVPHGHVLQLFLYNTSNVTMQLASESLADETCVYVSAESLLRKCIMSPLEEEDNHSITKDAISQVNLALWSPKHGIVQHDILDANHQLILSIVVGTVLQ
jgi:hypothetical protein